MAGTVPPWRALDDTAAPAAAGDRPTGTQNTIAGLPHSAIAIAGAAAVLAVGAFLLAFGASPGGTTVVEGGTTLGASPVVEGVAPSGGSAESPDLVVEVVGAIARPGVYRMAPGSRVGELVDAAGGYGGRVDTERASRELNLAALLRDGDQVRVPSRDDKVSAGQPGAPANGAASGDGGGTGPLDLNRATSAELEALPGIGPATAAKILGSREEQSFTTVDDLRTRKLVGEKTFDKLKDLVMVR